VANGVSAGFADGGLQLFDALGREAQAAGYGGDRLAGNPLIPQLAGYFQLDHPAGISRNHVNLLEPIFPRG
jgi:hypothetical protein